MSATSPLAWLSWAWSRLGRPGRLGVLLLVAAGLAGPLATDPLTQEADALSARSERLARRPPPPPAAASQDWLAHLPASHAGQAHLARLFAAAEKAGVSLEEGRYRESRDPESGLDRLAIVLPVTGRYPALRAFLANALEGEPSLALEGLRLSRDGIGESEVQAEVRFVLFLGGRP